MKGQVVLVTGGTSGIGLGIVNIFGSYRTNILNIWNITI